MTEAKRPAWWSRLDREDRVHEAGVQLRTELRTAEACDELIQCIAFAAGRTEQHHRELLRCAEEKGDESAVVLAHRIIARHREAVNASLADVKAWKAGLDSRQERSGDREG